jgi:hypothetical protein
MNRHLVLGVIIIMITAIMYAYALDPSILLKALSVEAQETANNNTTRTGTIDISKENPFYEATSGKVISQRVLDTRRSSSGRAIYNSKCKYRRCWKYYKPSNMN